MVRKGVLVGFIFMLFIGIVTTTANAVSLVNGDFETGDFSGWNKNIPPGGSAQVVTTHTGYGGSTYTPISGTYFAELKTDGGGSYTTISQSLTMNMNDELSGWAAFDYQDYHPFNDNAYIEIYDSSNNLVATPWSVYGNDVPNYWDGPWTKWSWTAPMGDTYTILFGVANDQDSWEDSYALFDDVKLSSPIPEPNTIILLSAGFLFLILVGIRGEKLLGDL